jgi:hypothetical protein
VDENEHIILEVCFLDELGYHLAPCQSDLTLDQKLFLFKAYPRFREMQKKNQSKSSGGTSIGERRRWEQRNKQLILDKRSKVDEQHFRGHLSPGRQS